MNGLAVTLSSKCWEGDYRTVLSSRGLDELFAPLGEHPRQVVLNRITDRADAQRRAAGLVACGALTRWAWAEEQWPALAARVGLPQRWFGPAWPFSVPELCELELADTPWVCHLAGDVRWDGTTGWLERAAQALERYPDVVLLAPVRAGARRGPAGVEPAATGWVGDALFSDQFFLARRERLLDRTVLTATHPVTGRYPKPGGALTFEARVGAWLFAGGGRRLVDTTSRYRHPVVGAEGDSYDLPAGPAEPPPPLPEPGPGYPPAGSCPATAIVLARDDERTIGATVASLRWLREIVVVDEASTDRTAATATAAGATVRTLTQLPASRTAALERFAKDQRGWVVHLNGDELVPPALAVELCRLIDGGDLDLVSVARRTRQLGRVSTGGAYRPDRQWRVFRADAVRFADRFAAPGVQLTGDVGARSVDVDASEALSLLRLGDADLHAWLDRVNAETTSAARVAEIPRPAPVRMAARAVLRSLLAQHGWRDGRDGLRAALLAGLDAWLLAEKTAEVTAGGSARVRAEGDQVAAQLLGQR